MHVATRPELECLHKVAKNMANCRDETELLGLIMEKRQAANLRSEVLETNRNQSAAAKSKDTVAAFPSELNAANPEVTTHLTFPTPIGNLTSLHNPIKA